MKGRMKKALTLNRLQVNKHFKANPDVFTQRGSLLIESLLGTMLMAVCLTVIMQSLMGSLKAVSRASVYMSSGFSLESRMDYLLKKGLNRQSEELVLESKDKNYQYNLLKEKVNKSDPQNFLQRLELRVKANQDRNTVQDTIVTWIFQPPEPK